MTLKRLCVDKLVVCPACRGRMRRVRLSDQSIWHAVLVCRDCRQSKGVLAGILRVGSSKMLGVSESVRWNSQVISGGVGPCAW